MLTYTAATEVRDLIKKHHLTRKVKGLQAWKPAAAACCQCIWPKAERTQLLQQHFSTLDSPCALPPTLSKVSQSPCCYRSTASPTKQQATRIRHMYPLLNPNLVWLHMTAYAERVHKGKGMQGTDIANLAQIQPLQTTPCTGLSRRARSSQHSSPSANLSISMPICINIFLQRERGKLPGGSWAGDP